MSLVYERMFATDKEAYEAVQQAQRDQGFTTSKRRSSGSARHGRNVRIDVSCHRSGKYRPWDKKQEKYKTHTKKLDCPFHVVVTWKPDLLAYQFRVLSEQHNHNPAEEPLASFHARQLSQREFGHDRIQALVEQRSRQNSSATPSEIARQITEEYPEVQVVDQDVWLVLRRLRLQQYEPHTSAQAFLRILKQDERVFFLAYDRGLGDKWWRIFWVYDDNVKVWKRNPELLMMDNTCKVNRFNLPLFQITGTTCLRTSFSAAFGLSSQEDTEAYTWMLKQLKAAALKAGIPLPKIIITDFNQTLKRAAANVLITSKQQLCVWHMMKNVTLQVKALWVGTIKESTLMVGDGFEEIARQVASAALNPEEARNDAVDDTPLQLAANVEVDNASQRALQLLGGPAPPNVVLAPSSRLYQPTADGIIAAWYAAVCAETDEDFVKQWCLLKREFPEQQPIIGFLRSTYLPEKHQFAHFAIQWHRNYGLNSTVRTESSHHQLKKFLDGRFCDLNELHTKIWEQTLHQRRTYNMKFTKETTSRRVTWDHYPYLEQLFHKVGWDTLEQLAEQFDLAMSSVKDGTSLPRCTGSFKAQWGLPCSHQLVETVQKEGVLQLEDLDCHWWLKAYTPEQHKILEERSERDPDSIPSRREVNNSIPVPLAHAGAPTNQAPGNWEGGYTETSLQPSHGQKRSRPADSYYYEGGGGKRHDDGMRAELDRLTETVSQLAELVKASLARGPPGNWAVQGPQQFGGGPGSLNPYQFGGGYAPQSPAPLAGPPVAAPAAAPAGRSARQPGQIEFQAWHPTPPPPPPPPPNS